MKKTELITMSVIGGALVVVLVASMTAVFRNVGPEPAPEVLPALSAQQPPSSEPSSVYVRPSEPETSTPSSKAGSRPVSSEAPASKAPSEEPPLQASGQSGEESLPLESRGPVQEDFAHTPNRNMPAFPVETTLEGPDGYMQGELSDRGYYHVGLDEWVDEDLWFCARFGQNPQATVVEWNDYRRSRISPYQRDGDYNPFVDSGSYYCASCHEWVSANQWENGEHGFRNPNHPEAP